MLLPADHVLNSTLNLVARLQSAASDPAEGSALQSLSVALKLMLAREQGDSAAIHRALTTLASRLSAIEALLATPASLATQFAALRAGIAEAQGEPVVSRVEARWRDLVAQVQTLAADIAQSGSIDAAVRGRIAAAFIAWECADLQEQLGSAAAADVAGNDTELTQERWRDYLRERFADPTLEVTAFRSLAGGFGKQTTLFDASGAAFNGAYVLRRDQPVTLFDNDCHRIENEYALIRAAHDAGFPAPEALWLDTEHHLVPGGHFLVMRRAPGVSGGSIFQARGAVPTDFAETLATIMARLHQLPPLTELGALTESIAPELWTLPLSEVVRNYLENWRALFLRENHLPSPAVISLFGWLLDHLPETSGRPALLHGDIGFHNLLFDEGRLSAVLDWEFGHIGDPAEDLAYVRNTLGASLDWPAFIAAYRAAGGVAVSAERLHFFQVWGHLRNACASNMVSAKFATRQVDELKLVLLPHAYIPQFLRAAQALIDQPA